MSVEMSIYRARIGMFIGITHKLKGYLIFVFSIILLQYSDIEKNPRPLYLPSPEVVLSNTQQHLSIVHYNVQIFYHKKR